MSQIESKTQDRLLFILVCLYWLSQSFLVPLVPVGPSWAVWPSLSDLVVLVMVPVILCRKNRKILHYPTQTVISSTWSAFYLCTASFLIATAIYGSHDDLRMIGAYQSIRLLEFLVVLHATVQVDMNLSRWKVFRWVSLSLFCLISAGVLLIFVGLVSGSMVTPFLPASPILAGPWGAYVSGSILDSGFISYNHAYAGIELILSGGVAYLCFEQSKNIRLLICILLLFSEFCTGSRATLIVVLLLVAAWEWKQAKSNLVVIVLLCTFACSSIAVTPRFENAVERQSSSASSLEEDGLSGRTGIWQEHLYYFAANPLNVILGTGYGYHGKVSTNNAHLLYLHVMTETGLAGLLFFLYLQKKTLFMLRSPHLRVMRLTVWGLLLTGCTQETLYPAAVFTHFVGFYLSALVMTLRYDGNDEGTALSLVERPREGVSCKATA